MISMRNLYRVVLSGILMTIGTAVTVAQNDPPAYVNEDGDSVWVVVDTTTMAFCFRHIPDEVLPTLSEVNRLDMLDFMESNMKAEVTNMLGGKSEMTLLTDTTLSIRMSNALQVDMLLFLDATIGTDSDESEVVCVIETFGTDSLSRESRVRYYTASWELLDQPPQLSVSEQNTISSKIVQTILKRDDEILKKN